MEEKRAACSNQEWLDQVYDKLLVKMKAECARVGTNIPYTTNKDGMHCPVRLLLGAGSFPRRENHPVL